MNEEVNTVYKNNTTQPVIPHGDSQGNLEVTMVHSDDSAIPQSDRQLNDSDSEQNSDNKWDVLGTKPKHQGRGLTGRSRLINNPEELELQKNATFPLVRVDFNSIFSLN